MKELQNQKNKTPYIFKKIIRTNCKISSIKFKIESEGSKQI